MELNPDLCRGDWACFKGRVRKHSGGMGRGSSRVRGVENDKEWVRGLFYES